MAELDRISQRTPLSARACATPGASGVRVFLRRVSPRGAMVQGEALTEPNRRGVLVLVAPGARLSSFPRWRFGEG